MSKKMKYIITSDNTAILFSECNIHSDFSHFNPISAGFCYINQDEGVFKVDCFGVSVSLKLESRGELDSRIIYSMLNEY